MIDIRLLRNDPISVKQSISRRGEDTTDLDLIIEMDEKYRKTTEKRDQLRNEIKELSRQVGDLRKSGKEDEATPLQESSREMREEEEALSDECDHLSIEIRELLLRVPNLPAEECPDGKSAEDNVVVRVEGQGERDWDNCQRVPHWEIGETLGILDVERATKLSGSMFAMYTGLGATLCRALIQYGLDRNADEYREIRPPTLVLTETMVSTGHLQKFMDDAYHLEREDLWAIPTA